MNNNTAPNNEERIVRQFLESNAKQPRPNKWFTQRVINNLPSKKQNASRIVMTLTTMAAVFACGVLTWHISRHFSIHGENNITFSLLSIYLAMMSSIILTLWQVIRLIKTYF